jgi:hypothetical protein
VERIVPNALSLKLRPRSGHSRPANLPHSQEKPDFTRAKPARIPANPVRARATSLAAAQSSLPPSDARLHPGKAPSRPGKPAHIRANPARIRAKLPAFKQMQITSKQSFFAPQSLLASEQNSNPESLTRTSREKPHFSVAPFLPLPENIPKIQLVRMNFRH